MKKIIAILMSLVMVLSFAACSKAPVEDESVTEAETVADEVVSEEVSEDVSEEVSSEELETLSFSETISEDKVWELLLCSSPTT